jgi:glycerol-3-phosphate dehydrogenase (NAD+)
MRIFSNQNEFHNMVFCLLLPFLAFSKRISIIGSGNWASTVSKLISTNIETKEELKEYNKEVRMWTIHEEFQGRNLTELINESHENSKYLKGYHLSSNIICTENIEYACQDADVICFVVPHQYAQNVLTNMKPYVKPTAVCVSLTKGMFFDTVGPRLLSDTIRQTLPISKVAVLMGANVAKDVAAENFVESTLACTDLNVAQELAKLFSSPHFRIELSTDVAGTELCGALKNVVALGVGFCDGLDYGVSSKAALITQGLKEIIAFNRLFAPDFQVITVSIVFDTVTIFLIFLLLAGNDTQFMWYC